MIKNAIEFKNITKSFLNGKLIANNKVSFSVKKGTIHTIVGENGAGKSTLLSILFGLQNQDSGDIWINGQKKYFKSANDAIKEGLGMVQQHFQLIEKFTVAQNILLGFEKNKFFEYDGDSNERINAIAKRYNFNITSNQKVKTLTIDQQQKVEILKLLYHNLDILIFDEPTAMLRPFEIESLLEIMLQLKNQGKTIIFITHKLEEIKKVSDMITVMRNGKVIETIPAKKVTSMLLSRLMVGKSIKKIVKKSFHFKENVLEIKNLDFYGEKNIKKLKNINFNIKKGEILALAGVSGNGQNELVDLLIGTRKIKKGTIHFNGEIINKKSIKERIKMGISHIPEDRHKNAMAIEAKIYENMILKVFDDKKFSFWGFLRKGKLKHYANRIFNLFDVRGADHGRTISKNMSGGNQQKAIVGRELSLNSNFLISFQATRGLDIGAINSIHLKLNEAKKEGKSILLISFDLNEIVDLADRVLVINGGAITGELLNKNINKKNIGILMSKKGSV